MSKSIIEIRRKSDGKILRDEINDACQTHNIYDGDVLVESNKDYNIGYLEGVGFYDFSDYEELADYEEQPMMITEEEKDLLLKDLCARLPYGVIVRGVFTHYNKNKDKILYEECDNELNYTHLNRYESLKPYLRPMSSMTEEEKKELEDICPMYNGSIDTDYESFGITILHTHPGYGDSFCQDFTALDWLNAHHFDYRGLIGKGLALPAKENMYND